MIIEQIRYFVTEENRAALLDARTALARIRGDHGVPAGHLFVADPVPDDAPAVIWQCGYADDGEMSMAEAHLIGVPEYETARAQLGGLAYRIELEIYSSVSE